MYLVVAASNGTPQSSSSSYTLSSFLLCLDTTYELHFLSARIGSDTYSSCFASLESLARDKDHDLLCIYFDP